MKETLPGNKRLLCTWMLLMALTALSMWSVQLGGHSRWSALPLWSIAVILAITGFKAQQILMVYLNLRVSSTTWKSVFLSVLAVTLLLVFSGYLTAHLH